MLKGLTCGGLILLVFRLIFKAIKALIVVVAYLLLYFGLWTVFVYMLFAGGLALWGGLNMAANDVNGILFKVGLVLSFLCSLILFFRNNLVKPLNSLFDKRREKKEYERLVADSEELRRREVRERERRISPRDGRGYEGRRDFDRGYGDAPRAERKESPLIYRSAKDTSKIIHEYRDRFEIFTVVDGKLVFVDVEYK